MLTITSETPYSEYQFDTKLQAKVDKSDQIFEQPEEEFMKFSKQQHRESKHIEK